MRKLCALLAFISVAIATCSAQVNPVKQINWPLITGSGAPTAACTALNYGQPYQNLSVTPNTYYTCGNDGWAVRSGSGGGSPGGTAGAMQYLLTGTTFGGLNGTGVPYLNGSGTPTIATSGNLASIIGSGVYDAAGAAAAALTSAKTYSSNASNLSSGTVALGLLPTSIPNANLANPCLTVNTVNICLGASGTVTQTGAILNSSSTSQTVQQNASSFGVNVQNNGSAVVNTTTLNLNTYSTGPGYYNDSGPWNGTQSIGSKLFNNTPGIVHYLSSNFTNLTKGDAASWYSYNLFFGGCDYGSDECLQGSTSHNSEIGYSEARIANSVVGGQSGDGGIQSAGYTYIYQFNNGAVIPYFRSSTALTTIKAYFNSAPATSYTLTFYIFNQVNASTNSYQLVQTIPVTVAAGTAGTQTWTAGVDFPAYTPTSGQWVGISWPSGNTGPSFHNSDANVCLAGTPSGTQQYAACYGSPDITITQAAPSTGATALAVSGYGCYHGDCSGQAAYGWATEAFLLDMQNATPPTATIVSRASGTNTPILGDYLNYSVTGGSFPTSTAWGTINSCTPSSNNQNSQVATSTTCQVNIATTPASPGSFISGQDACIAYGYQEEVAVTSVGAPSSGIQSVTFNTYHNYSGGLIMQGPPCGQYAVNKANLVASNLFWPIGYQILGSTGAGVLEMADCLVGGCLGPSVGNVLPGAPYSGNPTLTRTSNVVSAGPNPFVLSVTQYPAAGGSVVVSGCTVDTDLNGTYTIATNSQDNLNPVLNWNQTGANEGPDTTCKVANLPASISFYPGAIINSSPNTAGLGLEANSVPWVVGDDVRQSPASNFNLNDVQIYHGASSPSPYTTGGIVVSDVGTYPESYNFSAGNNGSLYGTSGLGFARGNGSYNNDFYFDNRPVGNGTVIYEAGNSIGQTVPYFLYQDGSYTNILNDLKNNRLSLDYGGYPVMVSSLLLGQGASNKTAGSGLTSSSTSVLGNSCSTQGTYVFVDGAAPGIDYCNGTTYVSAANLGTVTNVATPSASWPSWLVPTTTNATTTPSIAVVASAIPNSALANVATTVNGQTCTLGSTCTVTATNGIANVTVTLPTTAIAANTCTTPATVTMTGVLTTSAFDTAFATNPNAVNGWGANGGLSFTAWPTANTLNWSVCNGTAASITPGAMTLNVGAK